MLIDLSTEAGGKVTLDFGWWKGSKHGWFWARCPRWWRAGAFVFACSGGFCSDRWSVSEGELPWTGWPPCLWPRVLRL